jgi:hypothetical protein
MGPPWTERMEGGETVARLPNELYRALTREVNLLWNSEEDIKSTTGSRSRVRLTSDWRGGPGLVASWVLALPGLEPHTGGEYVWRRQPRHHGRLVGLQSIREFGVDVRVMRVIPLPAYAPPPLTYVLALSACRRRSSSGRASAVTAISLPPGRLWSPPARRRRTDGSSDRNCLAGSSTISGSSAIIVDFFGEKVEMPPWGPDRTVTTATKQ